MIRSKIIKSILIILGIVSYSIISIFYITPWSKNQILLSSLPPNINQILSYQIITLCIIFLFLFFIYSINKNIFKVYFKFGETQNDVLPEPFIGLNPKKTEKWKNIGINFAVIITTVTIIIMFFEIKDKNFNYDNFISILVFICIFSLSNAFVEEMMYRFGVVIALREITSDKKIALISGLIFGSIHYFGTPGGIIGMIVAGFLGWFLAKSIIETKGIFFAYLIHFLQDFIIFFALLLFI